MGAISTAVIQALGGIITSVVSGGIQSGILKSGEKESKRMYLSDLLQRNKELAAADKLTRDQMKQSDRQFKANLALNKEQIGLEKEQMARASLKDYASRLTGVLDKNENLKTLYINRLAGLRR